MLLHVEVMPLHVEAAPLHAEAMPQHAEVMLLQVVAKKTLRHARA